MELRIPWILDPVGMLESISSEKLEQESKLVSRFFNKIHKTNFSYALSPLEQQTFVGFFSWLCIFVTYNVQLVQPPQLATGFHPHKHLVTSHKALGKCHPARPSLCLHSFRHYPSKRV